MHRRRFIALLGAAITAARTLRAQQKPMPVIGWLSNGSSASDEFRLGAFRQGLNQAGYIEGQNFATECRWAQEQSERLPVLAADLVARQVTAIAAVGAPAALAAKAATHTIPIVFVIGIDPVQAGLVAGFNRPGGNMTGLAILTAELSAKRLELLHELVPTATLVALLVDPTNATSEVVRRNLRDAAPFLGLQTQLLQASTVSEINAALATLPDMRAGALVVSGGPFFVNQRAQIIGLAARIAVPAIYATRLFSAAGGLISYGGDLADSFREAGVLTGKILTGAQPADLPVQQIVKIELVINLNTAKALGLTVPASILARADEVIE